MFHFQQKELLLFSLKIYHCSTNTMMRYDICQLHTVIFSKWTAPLLTTLCYAINNFTVMKSRGNKKPLTYKEKENVRLTHTTHPDPSGNPYWSIPSRLSLFYFKPFWYFVPVLLSSCPWWAFLIVALDGSQQLVDLQGLPPQRIRVVQSTVQKLK